MANTQGSLVFWHDCYSHFIKGFALLTKQTTYYLLVCLVIIVFGAKMVEAQGGDSICPLCYVRLGDLLKPEDNIS